LPLRLSAGAGRLGCDRLTYSFHERWRAVGRYLSVKGPVVRLFDAHADRVEILSINPMFAPALGWSGHPVAVIEVGQAGPKGRSFQQLLSSWGASVEIVSADEHDRLTAAVQVATHAATLAFGATLLSLGYNAETAMRVATPPHRLLLTLLNRMVTQNPEVYWDIQAYHPHAALVRQSLIKALEAIQLQAELQDRGGFQDLFQKLGHLLSTKSADLVGMSERVIPELMRRP
jgi:4-amino-4-deoxyprephenate dehydrogenase